VFKKVQVNSVSRTRKLQYWSLASCYHTWLSIFTWRTSSSFAQIWDHSQNVHEREFLHHVIIQSSSQLYFTCPKGQQRLYLLNKITRNHLQLTASFLTTLHLNQRQRLRSKIILWTVSQVQQHLNFMYYHLIEEVSSKYPLQTAILLYQEIQGHIPAINKTYWWLWRARVFITIFC
jgi:hypothetical protein